MKPPASKQKVTKPDLIKYPYTPFTQREGEPKEDLNPGFSEKSKYFYMATLKKSEAVIDCFTAHFTWSPKSEHDMLVDL